MVERDYSKPVADWCPREQAMTRGGVCAACGTETIPVFDVCPPGIEAEEPDRDAILIGSIVTRAAVTRAAEYGDVSRMKDERRALEGRGGYVPVTSSGHLGGDPVPSLADAVLWVAEGRLP